MVVASVAGGVDVAFAFTRYKTLTRLKHSRHILTSAKFAALGYNAVVGSAHYAVRHQIGRYGY